MSNKQCLQGLIRSTRAYQLMGGIIIKNGKILDIFQNKPLSDIATLGSNLDYQLSWESGKSQLARWSQEVEMFPERKPPSHPPAAHLFLADPMTIGSLFWCAVPPPIGPLFRIYVWCPSLPVYTFSVWCPPPKILFCALNTLALSWILSKIENLTSSSLQDEAKLNLYPRVWHS